MAKNKENQEVLEVGVDVAAALADMAKLQRGSTRQFEDIARAVDELDRKSQKANSNAKKGAEESSTSLEDLAKAYKGEAKAIDNVLQNIELLSKKSATASDDERKSLEEQIKDLKKVGQEKIKNLRIKDKNEGRVAAQKTLDTVGTKLKEDITKSLQNFSGSFGRDLKGSFESGAKTLVKGLKIGVSAAALGGAAALVHGSKLKEKGKERGGVAGMAMSAGGAGLKAIGGLATKMGPLIQTLSQLGPILGMLGSSVMAVVKLLIDMDAKAKAFNKDILQSASTTEFMGRNAGNTDAAFDDLKTTLRGVRDAAFSLDNLDWGITANEHKAVLNVLNQEGVSFAQIHDEAKKVYGDMTDDVSAVQAFTGELTHLSVAFSRSFGVPLQEINQLQAEMVTELGSGLQDTALAFQRLKSTAEDTGVSANKFFAMIRGVSQDLSLWGNRMEDAVMLLGRMNKYMNPRNAQKFFQTTMQGLKNMGRTDRLRLSLLAGTKKTDDVLRKDIMHKARGLADQLGMSIEEFSDKFAQGPEAFEEALNKLDKSQQASVREALVDARLQAKRANAGAYGKALALRGVGAAGALEEKAAAISRFSGTKDLGESSVTLGGQAMAENLGISEEELDQMIKFELALKDQKKALLKQLKSGDASQEDAAREALKRAGIEGKDAEELAKSVDAAGYQDIMATFDDDTKKLYDGIGKTKDYAKMQADLTQSWTEKFEVFMDFMMNAVYGILMDIWDSITKFGDAGIKATRKEVLKSGDKEMIRALNAAGDNMGKFKEAIFKSDADFSKNLLVELKAGNSAVEKYISEGTAAKTDKGVYGIQASGKAVGLTPEQIAKIVNEVSTGKDVNIADAAERAGVKGDVIAPFMHQLAGQLESSHLPTLAGLIKPTKKPGGEIPKEEEPSPKEASKKEALTLEAPKVAAQMRPSPSKTVTSAAETPTTTMANPVVEAPVVTPPSNDAALKFTSSVAEDNLSLSREQLQILQSVDSRMDRFKMDTGFLSGPYSKAVEGSVLAAVRTALFEYYLYKDIDQQSMLSAMSAGGLTGRSMSAGMSQWQVAGGQGLPLDAIKPNAGGGVVTGIQNGMARVTAAAGEGLTSVGKGERIVPAGGGGNTTFQINVSGVGGQDLARIIEAKVIDGVHEYKRREKFS
jgi:hypothetical protein